MDKKIPVKKRTPDQLAITAQKKQIKDLQGSLDHWKGEAEEWQRQLNACRRECGTLVKAEDGLKRGISGQAQQISNHEDLLRDIQRDMKTVCEAAYGHHFDPTWRGDDPETLWHDGGEYRRVMQSTDQPVTSTNEYLEPIQRLVRMIWRRTHWGLNPLTDHVGRNF